MSLGNLTAGLLAVALVGCATAPTPRALGEAEARVASERAKRLSASRPNLIAEAKGYTVAARRAHEAGDSEAAELNAQLAVQRFDTAEHLEAREVAETQQRAMQAAVGEITETVGTAERERSALARFREAEGRFAAVEAELAQVRADDQSALANAQRAIVSARRKQAEAVGANAPKLARTQYEQGVTLLDNALGALQAGLSEESKSLAEAAEAQFAQALADAGTTGESNAAASAKTKAAKAKAQAALDDALTARASALAARMKQRDPARFEQGDALLEVAKMRFASADYEPAETQAKAALDVYRGKSTVSSANGVIQDAEEARADAIGRGAADLPIFAQAESKLDLARSATVDGDDARASKLAEQAKLLFLKAGVVPAFPTMAAAGVPAGAGQAPAAAGPSIQAALDRYTVQQTLMRLRRARADALSEGKQHKCPDAFNGFEAMLDLAIERFRDNALTETAQLTAHAEERLRTCGRIEPEFGALASTGPVAAKGAVDAKATAKASESAAERRARESAEAAIALGQKLFVKARLAKTPAAQLEEPQLYLQEAQRWYERRAWKQAQNMADEANKILRGGKPAPTAKPDTPAVSTLSKAELKEKQQAEAAIGLAQRLLVKAKAKKAPAAQLDEPEVLLSEAQRWYDRAAWKQAEAMAKEAATLLRAPKPAAASVATGPTGAPLPDKAVGGAGVGASPCPALDSRLSGARMARSMAGTRAKTPAEQAELQRVMRMQAAVAGLVKDGRCDEAAVFLTTVEAAYAKLGQAGAGRATAQAAAASDPAACVGVERRMESMRIAQGVASAAVRDADDRKILARAVGYLERGVDEAKRGECVAADASLDDAQKGFDWLARKLGAATPAAAQSGPAALSARDAIAAAQVARARAFAHRKTALFQTGSRLLEQAEKSRASGRESEAVVLANQARAAYESLGGDVAAEPTAAVAATPAATSSSAAAPAGRSGATQGGAGGGLADGEWKPAYQAILDTLVVRDRAQAAAKAADERARLETANGFMNKSRQSWDAKNYLAAGRYAEAARSDYEAVMALAEVRTAGGDAAAKARVTQAAERKIAAANKAKAAALASLEQVQTDVRAASAVLRDAEVLMARCEAKGCARADAGAFATASADLAAARAAFEKGEYATTETRGGAAAVALKALLAKPLSFAIPAGVTRVSRMGDQLELSPRVMFDSGMDTLSGRSLASVDELARVLIENAPVLDRVDLIGFTDSRGGAEANKTLSRQRAEALHRALVQRGVPSELLRSEGRGEADPIASNKTADGRERNRRVEVRLSVR